MRFFWANINSNKTATMNDVLRYNSFTKTTTSFIEFIFIYKQKETVTHSYIRMNVKRREER